MTMDIFQPIPIDIHITYNVITSSVKIKVQLESIQILKLKKYYIV